MATISKTLVVEDQKTYELEINLEKTYNLTVDIYSAASDTLSYTDDNGTQTVTTDATGKATGVNITITQPSQGVDPTITFTSSVAKNPDNLSNAYSKTIIITENTSEIYVMPDGEVLYWWGYKSNKIIPATGWSWVDYTYITNVTYGTNSVVINGTANNYTGIQRDQPVENGKNVTAIITGTQQTYGQYGSVYYSTNKTAGTGIQVKSASMTKYTMTVSGSAYIAAMNASTRSMTMMAWWID